MATALTTFAVVALLTTAGCNTEEIAGGHGTPVDAALFVGGVEVTPDITLSAGQPVRIEVRFLDEHGDEIHGLESGHYTSLTFTPASLATATPVADQRFFLDVTADAAGTGTVTVQ